MFLRTERNIGLASAAIVTLACAAPGHAAGIDDMVGRWGGNDSAYDCKAQAGTETQYVEVEKAENGYYVGAYAWGCTVKSPLDVGGLIGGDASCANEGDDENTVSHVELGLTNNGQLRLVQETGENVLNRCAAAN